ncbi:MAG: hypothetical protein NPIRA02_25270 [Nitrospirales bacterium]|nr:MAG: hypothetical protein NPIRA02_25270 [Nitrospirales bacterium]
MVTLTSKPAVMHAAIGIFGTLLFTSSLALAVPVQVSIQNLSPNNGIFLTPTWVGFHDGSFDLYDRGRAIGAAGLPSSLESLVEDGNTASLSTDFANSSAGSNGGVDGTVIGPAGIPGPIDPGERVTSQAFDIQAGRNGHFSYASMVIPSNDAFIANGNPFAHELFDESGNFVGVDFLVLGSQVLDGGTEVNTEMEAAFLNQLAANTGDVEGGVVQLHPGFINSIGNPGGTALILGATTAGPGGNITIDRLAADFTQEGYHVARVTVSAVPEPSTVLMFGSGFVGLVAWRWRKTQQVLH